MRPLVLLLSIAVGCTRPPAPSPAKIAAPAAPVAALAAEAKKTEAKLPENGWSETARAAHALSRLAFGARPGQVESIAKSGVEAWIRDQLEKKSDPSIDGKLAAFPATKMSIAEALEVYAPKKKGGASSPKELLREVAAQKLVRAVESDRQLEEVLVDFWFNHFNVDGSKGAVKWMVLAYERDAIRPHVFGTFRDLLGATAKHPAMLFYLDNWLSTVERDAPAKTKPKKKKARGLNENYARELLELHTLGVDGGYTQSDVREVARVFTGWSIEKPREVATFLFRPAMHDRGEKVVLGETFEGGSGVDEGERVLDLLARHPSTAKRIATKLARRFVGDDPDPALVERVAEVFQKSGGDLRATYEAIFFSKEMWSDAARSAKVKDPFELAVSAVRALGGTIDGEGEGVAKAIAAMGQPLHRCAPPTGYAEIASAWVASGALVARIRFGVALAEGKIAGTSIDPAKLVANAPPDAAALLDRVARAMHLDLSTGTRGAIVSELEKEPKADDAAAKRRLARAVGLVLGSPEFQRQ